MITLQDFAMRLNVISEKLYPARIGRTGSVFDFCATGRLIDPAGKRF
jgi:hypothetical protein